MAPPQPMESRQPTESPQRTESPQKSTGHGAVGACAVASHPMGPMPPCAIDSRATCARARPEAEYAERAALAAAAADAGAGVEAKARRVPAGIAAAKKATEERRRRRGAVAGPHGSGIAPARAAPMWRLCGAPMGRSGGAPRRRPIDARALERRFRGMSSSGRCRRLRAALLDAAIGLHKWAHELIPQEFPDPSPTQALAPRAS